MYMSWWIYCTVFPPRFHVCAVAFNEVVISQSDSNFIQLLKYTMDYEVRTLSKTTSLEETTGVLDTACCIQGQQQAVAGYTREGMLHIWLVISGNAVLKPLTGTCKSIKLLSPLINEIFNYCEWLCEYVKFNTELITIIWSSSILKYWYTVYRFCSYLRHYLIEDKLLELGLSTSLQ